MTEIKRWEGRVEEKAGFIEQMQALLEELDELRARVAEQNAELDAIKAAGVYSGESVKPVERVEPFCMHWVDRWGCNHYADQKEPHPENAAPLFTHPRQPMSDEQISDAELKQMWIDAVCEAHTHDVAEAYEIFAAALLEKAR